MERNIEPKKTPKKHALALIYDLQAQSEDRRVNSTFVGVNLLIKLTLWCCKINVNIDYFNISCVAIWNWKYTN